MVGTEWTCDLYRIINASLKPILAEVLERSACGCLYNCVDVCVWFNWKTFLRTAAWAAYEWGFYFWHWTRTWYKRSFNVFSFIWIENDRHGRAGTFKKCFTGDNATLVHQLSYWAVGIFLLITPLAWKFLLSLKHLIQKWDVSTHTTYTDICRCNGPKNQTKLTKCREKDICFNNFPQ